MSMLAEPRKKQKISINPQGEDWSTDDNKLGKKLLEKMGWSEGKGLGSKEDGTKEHIRVKFKKDNKGVGADRAPDEWSSHVDNFSTLLGDLAVHHCTQENNKSEEKNFSSLEQRSKTHKGRSHYQRFARGKDLSTRTDDELACVLGAGLKRTKSAPVLQKASEDVPLESNLNIVHSSQDLKSYFAAKMLARSQAVQMSRNGMHSDDTAVPEKCDTWHQNVEGSLHKKKKKKKKVCNPSLVGGDGVDDPLVVPEISTKKSRKRKRCEPEDILYVDGANDSHHDVVKKKKLKIKTDPPDIQDSKKRVGETGNIAENEKLTTRQLPRTKKLRVIKERTVDVSSKESLALRVTKSLREEGSRKSIVDGMDMKVLDDCFKSASEKSSVNKVTDIESAFPQIEEIRNSSSVLDASVHTVANTSISAGVKKHDATDSTVQHIVWSNDEPENINITESQGVPDCSGNVKRLISTDAANCGSGAKVSEKSQYISKLPVASASTGSSRNAAHSQSGNMSANFRTKLADRYRYLASMRTCSNGQRPYSRFPSRIMNIERQYFSADCFSPYLPFPLAQEVLISVINSVRTALSLQSQYLNNSLRRNMGGEVISHRGTSIFSSHRTAPRQVNSSPIFPGSSLESIAGYGF